MDEKYMLQAIKLAKQGQYRVKSNPLVGCIIVKDQQILGLGYHQCFGQNHAEINAINDAKMKGNDLKDSTFYITLEPCYHYGKTPPCVDAVIKEQPKRVVIAMADVNEKTAGKSIIKLQENQIQVVVGVCEAEAKLLNQAFIFAHQQKRSYLIMKSAMSLDGKIATHSGESKWITNELARNRGHQLRNEVQAIITTAQTVICDDPQLTSRVAPYNQSIKVIIDSHLRLNKNYQIFTNEEVIVAHGSDYNQQNFEELQQLENVKLLQFSGEKVDLKKLLEQLYQLGVVSCMSEAGARLNGLLLENNLVNEAYLFYAPIIIGSDKAKGAYNTDVVSKLNEAFRLENITIEKLGTNMLVRGTIV